MNDVRPITITHVSNVSNVSNVSAMIFGERRLLTYRYTDRQIHVCVCVRARAHTHTHTHPHTHRLDCEERKTQDEEGETEEEGGTLACSTHTPSSFQAQARPCMHDRCMQHKHTHTVYASQVYGAEADTHSVCITSTSTSRPLHRPRVLSQCARPCPEGLSKSHQPLIMPCPPSHIKELVTKELLDSHALSALFQPACHLSSATFHAPVFMPLSCMLGLF